MKSVVRKLFINSEKEEKWLNDMTVKGLNFVDYSFARYLFEEGTPGEYIYKLELLDQLPSHPESKAYIELMEQTGVECVSTYSRWFYFRKKSKDGPFDLNSDYNSCIERHKKVASLVGILGFLNLVFAILNVIIGLIVGNMKGYYNIYFSIVNWLIVILFTPMFISYIKEFSKEKKHDVTLPRFYGCLERGIKLINGSVHMKTKIEKDYNLMTVTQVKESGKPVAEVARKLDLSPNTLHGWINKLSKHGNNAFPGSGHLPEADEELRKLRKELIDLREENANLKKAASYFTKHQK